MLAAFDATMHIAPPFYPVSPDPSDLDAISAIIPQQLYLTNWRGATDVAQLEYLAITHIAAIGTEFISDVQLKEGLIYYRQDIVDDESAGDEMAKSLHTAAAFIRDAISSGGCCLVHCAAGVSRSTTCVLAYFVLHTATTLRHALAKVMQKRRVVWPNDGFMRALIVLEIETFGVASITIEEWIEWGDYDDSLHLLSSSATSGEGPVNAPLSREGRQELARFASFDASNGSMR